MEIAFDEMAQQDIQYWKKSGNAAIQKKIQKLLIAIQESPYSGVGKKEALKYSLAGKWSGRINGEHRIYIFYLRKYYPGTFSQRAL